MIDKNNVLIAAGENGYFRSKNPDRKTEIAEGIAKSENIDFAAVLSVLNEESARRSAEYRKREAAKLAKAKAEASKPISAGADSPSDHIEEVTAPESGVFVLTTAQNNTEIDREFMGALRNYCEQRGARLLIAKTTYNKQGYQQPGVDAEELWYHPDVKPYLVSGHLDLGGGVHFIADANVIPTAKNPVSGFEGVTAAGISAVIPAVKISLKCTAALNGETGKILFSTGAVTKRNYILRKAGAVAQSEHNIGALVVELDGKGGFKARQLEQMPGCTGFYDEGVFYTSESEQYYCTPAALQFGDIHAEKMESQNLGTCVDMLHKYTPDNLLIHDVLDFSSRNHHNIKDPAFMFAQHIKGETVAGDLKKVASVLDRFAEASPVTNIRIIESNHDLAINTWLRNSDYKLDPVNAVTYLTCMLAWYEHLTNNPNDPFNMLEFALGNIGDCEYHSGFTFHETDESVIIAGVEMGCHGHNGVNGSRGSPQQFRGLGVPMNTGHTHTPSICGPVYTAGVSAALQMGYNVGASSWRYAHIVTWPNGQRQIIFS